MPPSPGTAPAWFTPLSTPAKGLIITGLAATALGILAFSPSGQSILPSFTRGNFGYKHERTYDTQRNMYTDTFQTGGGERKIETPGGEIADLIATQFGLTEADYGPMTIAQRQKAYILIDQDGKNGRIDRYESEHVAPDVIRRIARENQKDY